MQHTLHELLERTAPASIVLEENPRTADHAMTRVLVDAALATIESIPVRRATFAQAAERVARSSSPDALVRVLGARYTAIAQRFDLTRTKPIKGREHLRDVRPLLAAFALAHAAAVEIIVRSSRSIPSLTPM